MYISNYIDKYFLQTNEQSLFITHDIIQNFSKEEICDQFINLIKKKLKLSIVSWKPSIKEYPHYILLNSDKGILAYVDFKYVFSNKNFSDMVIAYDMKPLLDTIRYAYSRLDRPIFFIYILNCKDKKGIFFETNEQIKDRWFNNLYTSSPYIPVFNEMGDLDNLIKIWNNFKKINIRK